MRKINYLIILILMITLTSCSTKKEIQATGYQMVYNDYVGIAQISVKGKKVQTLSIDEFYLPTTWAKLENFQEDLAISYETEGYQGKETITLAKYIQIGDEKFTAKIIENNPIYYSNKIENLKTWIASNEENAKWYIDNIKANNVYTTDKNGNQVELDTYAKTAGGYSKKTTDYWPQYYGGLGWKANIQALEEALIGTTMNFKDSEIVFNDTWIFAYEKSQATIAAAKEYISLVQKSYDNARKQM